jgi:demethylmenaquinone methyltransferase/2-methoxy-6-polyprenyl-1,4-benzoquinol methylase
MNRLNPDPIARLTRTADLFDNAAHYYDRIDFIFSFGKGRRYRHRALQRLNLLPGMKVLDVACGTGLTSAPASGQVTSSGLVVGVDASIEMLRIATRANRLSGAIQGAAERLPILEKRFDIVTMSYALRHVSDLQVTFKEYFRVLKPGGVLLILDFASFRPTLRSNLFRFYLKVVVPFLTRLGTFNPRAQSMMSYCCETIELFYPPEHVCEELKVSGFSGVRYIVECGVLSQYTATKPVIHQ